VNNEDSYKIERRTTNIKKIEQDNMLWEQDNILREQYNMLWEQNIFLVGTK
jgi:hypothetical protein